MTNYLACSSNSKEMSVDEVKQMKENGKKVRGAMYVILEDFFSPLSMYQLLLWVKWELLDVFEQNDII